MVLMPHDVQRLPGSWLLAERPDPVRRRQAKRLAKMGDRGLSEILEAQQRFVRNFTHFADGPEAGGRQHVRMRAGNSTLSSGVSSGNSGVGSSIFSSLIALRLHFERTTDRTLFPRAGGCFERNSQFVALMLAPVGLRSRAKTLRCEAAGQSFYLTAVISLRGALNSHR